MFVVAIFIFGTLFAAFTVGIGQFVVDWSSPLSLLYFLGFELLFVGVAYDLMELLLCVMLRHYDLPRQSPLDHFPPVALLMTVCNDAMPKTLEQLRHQTYPNYDVFILDDSTDESCRALVDRSGYTVLRRGTQRGFKAGNLNHWLDLHGARYKYFVTLDSDSLVDNDFITRMVEYAEHPHNQQVAVFQSKILPWNTTTPFSRVMSATAPLRIRIQQTVGNQTGTTLSFGHNNLTRTKCVLRIGGFHENLTAEDTTLSLMLSAEGFVVKLVDVLSYDTEPEDAFRYARRTIRWAKQTVELFRLPWHAAALRLKLLLCYHLYNYLIYSVYLGLLLLAAWTFKAEGWSLHSSIKYTNINQLYLAPWFMALVGMTGLWIGQVVLHIVLARNAGVSIRDFLLHSLLVTPLMYFLVFPLTVEILRTALGAKTPFIPTNSKALATPSLLAIMRYMWPTLVYGVLVLIGVLIQNRYLIYSLNGLWLFFLLTAPLVLWLFHGRPSRPFEPVN